MTEGAKLSRLIMRGGFLFVWACLVTALSANVSHAQDATKTLSIGTGGKSGVYYPVGVSICDIMRRTKSGHGLDCLVHSTGGSVDNIKKLQSGEVNFAIVQSDILYYAIQGFGPFKDHGPDPDLRTVLSLHNEAFTVLARADAGIRSFDDLRGKRVNIGNPGSGQRTFLELLMRIKGWGAGTFAATLELPADEQGKALCDNQVDAIVYVVGHPNAAIKTAASSCPTVLVEVHDDAVHKLIDKYPYFTDTVIKGKAYPGSPSSTKTFGATATVVTLAKTPDDVVFALTKTIFNSFTDLKFSNAALFDVTPQGMVSNATAPHHPGTLRFIKDATNLDSLMSVKPPVR